MVAPTFKFTGIKMNPDNEYIIEGFHWLKTADPNDIITVAQMSHGLRALGFIPTMKLVEIEEGQNIHGVAIINHPIYGSLKISIVDGPDFSAVKNAFDIDLEMSIINEKATFKQNIHKAHNVRQ